MRRLRDFASIVAFFTDREIDELQAAVDTRRETRAVRPDQPPEARTSRHDPKPDESGSDHRRVAGV